jgi:hypothetical protein
MNKTVDIQFKKDQKSTLSGTMDPNMGDSYRSGRKNPSKNSANENTCLSMTLRFVDVNLDYNNDKNSHICTALHGE